MRIGELCRCLPGLAMVWGAHGAGSGLTLGCFPLRERVARGSACQGSPFQRAGDKSARGDLTMCEHAVIRVRDVMKQACDPAIKGMAAGRD